MIVRLEDVCFAESSSLKQSDLIKVKDGYPVYGASGFIANIDKYQQEKPYVSIVKDGAGVGRVQLCPGQSSVIGTMQYIIPKENVLPEYLYYVTTYMHLEKYYTGATIPHIYFKNYKKEKFNLDPIEKQKNIVKILDGYRKIIELRQEQLQKYDDLIKSRFVEMFDDYEWSTTLGNYIGELRGGKSLAGTEPCKNKVLKTGAATFGWFDSEQYKYLPQNYNPLPEHKVETGDVMISRMNTPELVGACSYVFEAPEDMYYPDRLWKVIPHNQAHPIFIWQLLWNPEIKRQIKEKSGGTSGTMHNISKQKLLEIKCIDVPINKQDEFAKFVIETYKSKVAIQAALDKTQLLFDSLMQEYFG